MIKKSVRTGVKKMSILQQQVRKNTATAVLGAFALIIAFVWRDAIQAVVDNLLAYLHIVGTTAQYKIYAALITTLICTFGIMYFSRWGEKTAK